MRRRVFIAATLVAVAVAAVSAAPAPSASAATSFTGRVVDSWTGEPLVGVTLWATETDGTVIADTKTLTGVNGAFTLPGLDGEEYGLRVDGRSLFYEAGYVGGAMPQPFGRSVVQGWVEAATWSPGKIGNIGLDGRLFRGTVVDADTGDPLAGVTVAATDVAGVVLPATTVVTDVAGRFRVAGDLDEEHGVWFDGSAVGYEAGYLGGVTPQPFGHPVVSTWPEAATWAPGTTGPVGLHALVAPGPLASFSLVSASAGSLTLKVKAPSIGTRPFTYDVRCTRLRTTVTRSFNRSGDTRRGFASGANTCRVRAVNTAGVGPWASRPVTIL